MAKLAKLAKLIVGIERRGIESAKFAKSANSCVGGCLANLMAQRVGFGGDPHLSTPIASVLRRTQGYPRRTPVSGPREGA